MASVGVKDPRESLTPFVEELLALRAAARDAGDYPASDRIRDRLTACGIEVRDTPAGVEWELVAD